LDEPGDQFFMVAGTGTPQAIACPVWDFVFQNMNTGIDPVSDQPYIDEVIAGANSTFNEVSWFFKTQSEK
jgi:hypothetical protein